MQKQMMVHAQTLPDLELAKTLARLSTGFVALHESHAELMDEHQKAQIKVQKLEMELQKGDEK